MKDFLRFETERLVLRDYCENDFESYYRLRSDSKTMYYLQDLEFHSIEEARGDFELTLSDMKSPCRKFYFFHIELKDSHEQVGSIGYTVLNDTPAGKIVQLGYFTYPKFWGKGYVSEAVRKVLEFAFTQNNVYLVTTGCLAENKGSERVMQKCGLIKEAEHKDYEWHDGKMKTRLEYRLLKSEWEKTSLDKATLTGIIDRLERDGFVKRIPSQKDKRVTLISRTGKDEFFKEKIPQVSAQQNSLFYKGFSPDEIEEFENYLKRILENCKEAEKELNRQM